MNGSKVISIVGGVLIGYYVARHWAMTQKAA